MGVESRTLWQGGAILQLVVIPQIFFKAAILTEGSPPSFSRRKVLLKSLLTADWYANRSAPLLPENDCSSMRHFLQSAPAWEWYPHNNKSRSSWNDITMLSRCLWQIFPHTKALQILFPVTEPVCFGTPSKRRKLQIVWLLSIQLQLFTHQGAAIAQCHWLFIDPYAEVSHKCWALLKFTGHLKLRLEIEAAMW